MSAKRLTREFFNRDTLMVAKELLGKFLVRKTGKRLFETVINETEAYCGPDDLACHASKGRTPRTETLFGPPGHAYIYLIYGMYHCLNVVTEKEGYPAAVLIRGVELDGSKEKMKLDGPGKLTKFLEIDSRLNKIDLITHDDLWIEDRGMKINPRKIKKTPRVGVDYAKEYADKPWRFVLR